MMHPTLINSNYFSADYIDLNAVIKDIKNYLDASDYPDKDNLASLKLNRMREFYSLFAKNNKETTTDFLYSCINKSHVKNCETVCEFRWPNQKAASRSSNMRQSCCQAVYGFKTGDTGIITKFFESINENWTLEQLWLHIQNQDEKKSIIKVKDAKSENEIEKTIIAWDKKQKDKIKDTLFYNNPNFVNSNTDSLESEGTLMSTSQIISTILKTNRQIIFTGAPGTGKTYSVREYIKNHTENEDDYKFVQFHPSYDYSDFVEGLRPVTLKDANDPTFVRIDGVFKAFCRHIAEENLDIVKQKWNCSDYETALNELYSDERKYEKIKDKKVKTADEQKLCEKLTSVYNKKYYFVVDEINRADLSKVFGELMFGLEESYRGVSNRFDTQYKNLKTYQITKEGHAEVMKFDIFEKGFFIPQNLVFIGTMNDIDRSVESFDFALRRRFQWIDIKANKIMESTLKSMWESKDIDDADAAINRIIAMNEVMTSTEFEKFGLSEAYHIGPAYFKSYDGTDESMETIFTQKIEPILREYTRGRKTTDVNALVNKCYNTLLGK